MKRISNTVRLWRFNMHKYASGFCKIIPAWFGYSFSVAFNFHVRKYYFEIDAYALGAGIYIRIGKVQ